MPDITMKLTEEDQAILSGLLDQALRHGGRQTVRAFLHWEAKLLMAQKEAAAPSPGHELSRGPGPS